MLTNRDSDDENVVIHDKAFSDSAVDFGCA